MKPSAVKQKKSSLVFKPLVSAAKKSITKGTSTTESKQNSKQKTRDTLEKDPVISTPTPSWIKSDNRKLKIEDSTLKIEARKSNNKKVSPSTLNHQKTTLHPLLSTVKKSDTPILRDSDTLMHIGDAAKFLKVSIDTLRRWEKMGKISPTRTPGGTRLYSKEVLEQAKTPDVKSGNNKTSGVESLFSISEAAKRLGVSTKTLRRWDEAGKLIASRNKEGERVYKETEIEEFTGKSQETEARRHLNVRQGDALPSSTSQIEPEIITIATYELSQSLPQYIKRVSVFAAAALVITLLLTSSLVAGYFTKPQMMGRLFAAQGQVSGIKYQGPQTEKISKELASNQSAVDTIRAQQQILGESTSSSRNTYYSLLNTFLSPFNNLAQNIIEAVAPAKARDLGFYQKNTDARFDLDERAIIEVDDKTIAAKEELSEKLSQTASTINHELITMNSQINSTTVNLLRNSSFEKNASGQPDSWFYVNESASNNTIVNNASVRTGNHALLLEPKNGRENFGIYQPYFVTKFERPYTLSLYLDNQSAQTFTLKLGFWDKNNNRRIAAKDIEVASSPGWKRYSYTLDPPDEGVTGLDFYPMIEALGLSAKNVFIDDIQLEEGEAASTYEQENMTAGDGSIAIDANGNITPTTSRTGSLGTDSFRFGSLYLTKAHIDNDGNANFGGSLTVASSATIAADLTVNGDDIQSSSSTFRLFPENVLNLTIGGSATAIGIGSANGTTTINNNLAVTGTSTFTGSTTFTGGIALPDGSSSTPALRFTNDTDSGLYRLTANTLRLTTAGSANNGVTINSVGNVGIGNTSPLELLEAGTTNTASDNYLRVSAAGGNAYRAGIKMRVYNEINGATIEYDNRLPVGLNFLLHDNDAAGQSAMFIAYNTRYVGIGTTAPGNLLTVNGNVGIGTTAFVNAGLSVMTGNVGIGTTSPSQKLDVAGSANLSTGNTYKIAGNDVLSGTTLGTGVLTSSLTTVGALASGSIASGFGTISTGNTITTTGTMGTAGTTTFTGAGGTFSANVNANGGLDIDDAFVIADGGALTTSQAATFNSNVFFGTSTGILESNGNVGIGTTTPSVGTRLSVMGGNVGIGTTAPGAKLNVVGDAVVGSALAANNTIGWSTMLQVIGTSYPAISLRNTSGTVQQYDIGNNAGPLQIYDATAGAYRFTLTTGGNVGIGSDDTPDYQLELYDATNTPTFGLSDDDVAHSFTDLVNADTFAHLTSLSTTSGGALLQAFSDGDASGFNLKVGIGTTNPTDSTPAIKLIGGKLSGTTLGDLAAAETVLQVANNDDAPALSVMGSGNIGIGTTTSTLSRLTIAGGSATTGLAFLVQDSAYANRFAIQGDGNVGIGTTVPDSKMHIKGTWVANEGILQIDADSGTQYSGLTIQNNGTYKFLMFNDNTAGSNYIASAGTEPIIFAHNSVTEKMRLDPGGNLGIGGDTSPDYRLELYDGTNTPTFGMSDDDVSHSFTDLVNADTFAHLTSLSTTSGGGLLQAFSDGDASGFNLKVGIGTTNPTDSTPAIKLIGGKLSGTTLGDLAATETVLQIANNDDAPALSVMGSGNIGIGTTTSTLSRMTVAGGSATTGLAFLVQDSAYANRFAIQGDGNVGIGTTLPGAILDLASTSTTGPDFRVTNTGIITGTVASLVADSLTTGTLLDLSLDGLTTGKGINLTSTSNVIDSATLLNVSSSSTAATDTSLSADIANLSFSPIYSTAVTTPSVTGQVLDISRTVTTNSLFASTLTLSGAVATFSDTATQTTGTLTSTADVVQISQNYTGNSGAALNITTASTNTSSFALRVNDDGTLTDSTPFVVDFAGNVGIGTTSPLSQFAVASSNTTYIDMNYTGSVGNIRGKTGASGQYGRLILYEDTAGLTDNIYLNGSWTRDDNTQVGAMFIVQDGEPNIYTHNGSLVNKYKFDIESTYNQLLMYNSTDTGHTTIGLLSDRNEGGYIFEGGSAYTSWGKADSLNILNRNNGPIALFSNNSTSNVLLLSSAGNVGIGTTSPLSLLQLRTAASSDPSFSLADGDVAHGVTTVAPTDDFLRIVPISSTVGGAYINGLADATGVALQLRGIQSSDPTDSTPAIFLVGAKASGTGVVDLGAAETVFQVANNDDAAALTILGNGNVGIGTTSPLALTHIYQTGSADALRIDDSASDTSYFVIDQYGNVGIGVTTPLYKLEVNGTAYFGGALTQTGDLTIKKADPSLIFDTTTVTDTDFWIGVQEDAGSDDDDKLMIGDGTTPGSNIFLTLQTDGNVGIGTTSPAWALDVAGSANISSGSTYKIAGTDVLSSTVLGSGVVTSSLTTVGALASGSIASGFGTISTGNTITTTGTMGTAGTTTFTGAGGTFSANVNANGGLDIDDAFVVADGGLSLTLSDNFWMGLGSGAARIEFDDQATDEINFLSANVGIGTTAPGVKLDVNGSLRAIGRTIPSGGKGLEIFYDTSDYAVLEAYDYDTSAYKQIRYAALGHIFSTGNIGIGTTSPLAALDVRSDTGLYLGAGSDLQITLSSDDIYFKQATQDKDVYFQVNDGGTNTNLMFFDGSTSYVGIGTTAPGRKLEISGTDSTSGLKITGTNSNRSWLMAVGANSGDGKLAFYDYTADAHRLIIDTVGNVGIGTTAPFYSFEIRDVTNTPTFGLSDDDVAHSFTDLVNADTFAHLTSLSTTAGGGLLQSFSDGDASGFNLKVGIGTTNPTDSTPAIKLIGGKLSGTTLGDLAATETVFQVANNDDAPALSVMGSGNIGIGTTTSTLSRMTVAGGSATTGLAFLVQDSAYANRFAIQGDGNVGIGTTAPSYKLDVAGAIVSQGLALPWVYALSTASNTPRLSIGQGSVDGTADNNYADLTLDGAAYGNTDDILFRSYYSAAYHTIWRTPTGTSNFTVPEGNVGIGTTSPGAKLDLASTSTTGPDFRITNTGAVTGTVASLVADSLTTGTLLDLSLDALTTGKGINLTSTSNAIDSGILLNVSSSSTAATDTSLSADIANLSFAPIYSTAVTTPSVSGQVLDISRTVTTNSLFASTLTLSGAVATFSDTATQTTGTLTSTADVVQISQNYTGNSGAALNITTASTNTSAFALRVNDDGTLTDSTPFVVDYAGNVGIGTTGPTNKLEITGSGYNELKVTDTGTVGANINLNATGTDGVNFGLISTASGAGVGGGMFGIYGGTGDYRFALDNGGNVGIGGAITANFAGASMVVKGGNVGIGTTSPLSMLQLRTAASSDPSFSLADGDVAHGVTTVAPTDDFLRVVPISSTVGGAYINGLADATGVALQLRGIQSSDPTDSTPAIFLVGAKASGTGVQDLGAAETVFQVANNDDAAALTILGNGNVGIGTTSPADKLQVGSLSTSQTINTYLDIYGGLSSNTGLRIKRYDGNYGFTIEDINALNGLNFIRHNNDATGVSAMFISEGTGNVGIGTTSPGGTLELAQGLTGASSGTNYILKIDPTLSGAVNTTAMTSLYGTYSVPAINLSGTSGTLTNWYGNYIGGSVGTGTTTTVTNWNGIYVASPTTSATGTITNKYALITEASAGNIGIGTTTSTLSRLTIAGGGTGANLAFLVQDSAYANRFAIQGDGNVGIGTTAPTYKLDVLDLTTGGGSHDVLRVAQEGAAAAGNSANILFDASSTNNSYNAAQGRIRGIDAGDHGLDFAFDLHENTQSSNIYERMRITSYGNVGIGTTSPVSLLQLRTAASSDPSFSLADGDVAHGVTTVAPTDDFLRIVPISSTVGGAYINGLADATGVALQLRGIQSSDPTDSTPAIFLVGAKASGTGVQDLGAAETVFQVANNDDAAALTILGNGNVGIGTTGPAVKLDFGTSVTNVQQIINIRTSGNTRSGIGMSPTDGAITLYSADNEGGIRFGVIAAADGTTWTQRMHMTQEGNLGIGIDLPLSKLGIEGNAAIGSAYSDISAPTNGLIVEGNVGIGTTAPLSMLQLRTAASSDPSFSLADADVAHSFTSLAQADMFYHLSPLSSTAGGAQLQAFSDGDASGFNLKVGIGTTNPTDSTPAIKLMGGKLSGTTLGDLAAAETILTIANNDDAPALTILGNGNVGIGTTAPAAKLDVIGTTFFGSSSNTRIDDNIIRLNAGNTPGALQWSNNQLILYGGSTGLSIRDDSGNDGSGINLIDGGNVGIGTTSPLALTHIYQTGSADALRVDDSAADTTYFVVDQYGNVGIGTTSPTYKLDVTGDGRLTTGLTVGTTAANSTARASLTINGDETIKGKVDLVTSGLSGVTDVYVYDTTKDSDGGKWRNDERAKASSWYNETIDNTGAACTNDTDDRCGRKEFPEKAIIVATSTDLYIFDAKDNTQWMNFDTNGAWQASSNAIGISGTSIDSVYALNGVLYATLSTGNEALARLDFKKDESLFYRSGDGPHKYNAGLGSRNAGSGHTNLGYGASWYILDITNGPNDVFARTINGKTYVAVATDAGFSVINETDQVIYDYADNALDDYNQVWLDGSGNLWATNETTGTLEKWNNVINDSADENPGTPDSTWDETTTPALAASAPTIQVAPGALYGTDGTSTVDGKSPTVYIGTDKGLTVLQTKAGSETAGSVKYYTKTHITEEMVGDTRGMWSFSVDGSDAALGSTVAAASTLGDASLKNSDLTVFGNTMNVVTGVRGKALQFDGSTNYLKSTATTFSPGTGSMSAGAWINASSALPDGVILHSGNNDTSNTYWRLFIGWGGDNQNKVAFGIHDGTTGSGSGSSPMAVNDDKWHFVVGVRDTVTDKVYIYVDGVQVNSGTDNSGNVDTSTLGLWVGVRGDGGTLGLKLNGSLDEPFVTMSALTPGEIKHMYEVGKRALDEHTASRITGVTGADNYQRLMGNASGGTTTSNTVKAVAVDSSNQFIYAGVSDATTNTGGVTVLGVDSDSAVDLYDGTANTGKDDDAGTQFSANDVVAISLSGTPIHAYNSGTSTSNNGAVIAIAGTNDTATRAWMQSNDYSLYSTLAQLTSPDMVKDSITATNIFKVFNTYNNITNATTGERIETPALSVDSGGNLVYNYLGTSTSATALDFNDSVLTTGSMMDLTSTTLTTGTVLGLTANALTSGTGLNISSSATAMTGTLEKITLSGSNAANTGSLLELLNSGTANANTSLYIKHYATGTGNYALRVDDVSGDTSPFVIQGDGNVGIGTTSPGDLIHVRNGSGVANLRLEGNSGNPGLMFYVGSTLKAQIYEESGDDTLRLGTGTGAQTDLVILGNGNIGIGTATPATIFDVNAKFNVMSGGNVGIGTTAPGALLHVNGTMRATQIGTTTNAVSYQYNDRLWLSTAGEGIYWADTYNAVIHNVNSALFVGVDTGAGRSMVLGASGYRGNNYDHGTQTNPTLFIQSATDPDSDNTQWLSFAHDQSDGVITTGKGDLILSPATGNVGIGTTSPASILHLESNAPIITLQDNDTAGAGIPLYLQFRDSGGNVQARIGKVDTSGTVDIQNISDQPVRLWTNNTVRFEINSVGNIGIGGDSTPDYQLELYDGTNTPTFGLSDDDVAHSFTDLVNADTFAHLTSLSTTSGGGLLQAFSDGDASGFNLKVGIGTTNPTDSTPAIKLIGGKLSGTTLGDLGATETVFQIANNDDAAALSILGNGNVGIGTTGPAELFQIMTGSTNLFKVNTGGAGTFGGAVFATGVTVTESNLVIPAGSKFLLDSGGDTYFIETSANNVDIFTGGTQRMRWDSAGNVGIGTTNPGQRLDIQTVATDYQLRIGHTSGYYYDIGRNPSDGFLYFNGNQSSNIGYVFSGADGERMRIASNGNVGIGGDTTPNALFSVGSTSQFQVNSSGYALLPDGANSTPSLTFTGDTNTGLYRLGTDILSLVTGGSDRLTIGAGGNIGIGTTGPGAPLEIQKAIADYTEEPLLILDSNNGGDNSGSSIQFKNANQGYYAAIASLQDTKALDFRTSTGSVSPLIASDSKMVINRTGNVGIGTTSPLSLLQLRTAASSDPSFSLADGDVAHGVTTIAPTDDFLRIVPISSTVGGAYINGLADATGVALQLRGIQSSDPTDSTPAIFLVGAKANGTGVQDLGATETVFQIANNDDAPALSVMGSGNIGIGTTTSTLSRLTIAGGSATTGLAFLVQDSAYANRFAIQGNGNVGIGTTAPVVPLEIRKSGTGVCQDTNSTLCLVNAGIAYLNLYDSTNSVQVGLVNNEIAGYVGTISNHPFSLAANNTKYLTVATSGNVGIGTTSPSGTLELAQGLTGASSGTNYILKIDPTLSGAVNTTAMTSLYGNYSVPAINLSGTSGTLTNWYGNYVGGSVGTGTTTTVTNWNGIYVASPTTSATGTITNKYALVTEASAGNIGIGTTTSTLSRMTVVGGSATTGLAFLVQDSAYTNRFAIQGNGNVGIGTTSPSYKLSISDGTDQIGIYPDGTDAQVKWTDGDLYLMSDEGASNADSIVFIRGKNNGVGRLYIEGPDDNGDRLSLVGENTYSEIQSLNNELRITTGANNADILLTPNGTGDVLITAGNVGIGTTSPSTLFELKGGSADGNYLATINNTTSSGEWLRTLGSGGNVGISLNQNPAGGGRFSLYSGTSATASILIAGGDNEHSYFNSGGNIGIGTTSPAHKLDVVGTAGLSTGTLWTNTSDSRVKQDIETIPNALDLISQLKPSQYNYTPEYLAAHPEIKNVAHFGFIAQEFQQVFPDWVTTGSDGYLQVNASNVIPYAIKAIQEQQGQITSLQSSVLSLQTNQATTSAIVANLSVGGDGKLSSGVGFDSPEVSTGQLLVSGNVGIGTTNPGAYKLAVNGPGFLNDTGWTYASDSRLKEKIEGIGTGLAIINALNPVTFDYINGGANRSGFIAQEVAQVLPSIVSQRADGMLALRTEEIVPYTVKAIQELNDQVAALRASQGDALSAWQGVTLEKDGTLSVSAIKAEKLLISTQISNLSLQTNGSSIVTVDPEGYSQPVSQTQYVALESRVETQESRVESLEDRIKALEEKLAHTTTTTPEVGPGSSGVNPEASSSAIAGIATSSATLSTSTALSASTSEESPASPPSEESSTSVQLAIAPEASSSATASATSSASQTPEVNSDNTKTSGVEEFELTAPEILLATTSAQLVDLTVTSSATISGKLVSYDLSVQNTFKSFGQSILGNTTIAGDLSVDGTLSITRNSINSIGTDGNTPDVCRRRNTTSGVEEEVPCSGILYFQNSPLSQAVDFFNGRVTIDKTGKLTAQEIVTNIVTTGQVNIIDQDSSSTIGTSTLTANQTRVAVFTDKVTQGSKIFITPRGSTAGQALFVEATEAGVGFVVSIDQALTHDLDFDWWIIEVK